MDTKPAHPHNFGPSPKFNNIPDELKTGKWCVWKAKPRKRPDGSTKYDKVPFNGIQAISTSQPDTWLDFNTAKQLYEQGGYNGVGRLAQKDGLTFIDIDNAAKLPPEVKSLGETYCEKSPSGSGWRLVYRTDTPPSHDITSPFEVYSGNSARFLTITGNTVVNAPIANKNGQLDTLVSKHSLTKPNTTQDDPFAALIKTDITPERMRETLTHISADDDHTWVKVAAALHFEFDGSDEGFDIFDTWSKTSPKYEENDTTGKTTRSVWDRQSTDKSSLLTFRSILQMAKDSEDSAFIEALKEPTPPSEPRFTHADALLSTAITPPTWVVKHMLERDSLAMMYGASGAGKSYVAIRLATAVSNGTHFHSHQTKQGTVVYMCGEGYRGVVDRLRAISINDSLASLGALYLTNRITDFSNQDDVTATVKELTDNDIHPDLVIIDTLARASGGFDENSTADMNKFVLACDYMRRQFKGAAIMPIHHTGKGDKSVARGSSVLRAAMDVEIMVEPAPEQTGVVVSSTKAKDGEPFDRLGFRFKRINFGVHDEDGDELYSHLITPDQTVCEAASSNQKLTPSGAKVVKSFDEVFEHDFNRVAAPQKFIDQFGLNAPTEGVLLSDLRDHYKRVNSHDSADTNKKGFKRGLDDATTKDVLAIWDEVVVKL